MLSVFPFEIYKGSGIDFGILVVCVATRLLAVPFPIQNSTLSILHLISNEVLAFVHVLSHCKVDESAVALVSL